MRDTKKPHQNSNLELEDVPLLTSKRWYFAYIGVLCLVLISALRVDMSLAIVCMVKDANSTTNTNTPMVYSGNHTNQQSSSCRDLDFTPSEYYNGEFEWDKSTQSIVLSSFFYGYIVTQIPGGLLASRFGGKRVVGICNLVASLATILTPLAARWDYTAVVVLRAMMGLVQGVTYPAIHTMLGRWAPPAERTRLTSFVYSGSKIGMIVTYISSGQLCAYGFDNGWGSIFYIIGGAGVLWVVAWFYIAADTPDSHSTISKVERDYIVNSIGEVENKKFDVPWASILKSRALWACLTAHVSYNWIQYTLLTGLPTFMKEVLKFDMKQNGLLSAVPYMIMTVTSLSAGHVADVIRSKYLSTTQTRKLFQCVAFIFTGGLVVAVGFVSCDQRALAVTLLSIAAAFYGLSYAGFLVNPMDFAPRHAGILLGITNCLSTIPGIVSPILIGQLTPNKSQEEWRNVFYVCGGFALVGALVFGCFAQGELEPWAVERSDKEDEEKNGTQPICMLSNLRKDDEDEWKTETETKEKKMHGTENISIQRLRQS